MLFQKNNPESAPEIGRPNHWLAACLGEMGGLTPSTTLSSRTASMAFVIRSVRLRPGFVPRPIVELLDAVFPYARHRRRCFPNGISSVELSESPNSLKTKRSCPDEVQPESRVNNAL